MILLGLFSSENEEGFTRVKRGHDMLLAEGIQRLGIVSTWNDITNIPKNIASHQGGTSRPSMFAHVSLPKCTKFRQLAQTVNSERDG